MYPTYILQNMKKQSTQALYANYVLLIYHSLKFCAPQLTFFFNIDKPLWAKVRPFSKFHQP